LGQNPQLTDSTFRDPHTSAVNWLPNDVIRAVINYVLVQEIGKPMDIILAGSAEIDSINYFRTATVGL